MSVTSFDEAVRAAITPDAVDSVKREQSTILFPYLDLDSAVEVARAVYNRSGHGACEIHELAAEMKQVVSGAFRLKTGTARIFEFTEKEGRGGIQLTELGRHVLSPETEQAARAEAFMRVPLYAKVYEKYKGQRLPPTKALEREMLSMGVSSKQTDKARQAFDRSARQAGYFLSGDDRLVRPRYEQITAKSESFDDREPLIVEAPEREHKKENSNRGGLGGGGMPPGKDHPLITGLLMTLPDPGNKWEVEGRAAWLRMAGSIFNMIYEGPSADLQITHRATNSGD